MTDTARIQGSIKWFDQNKGYGFIVRDDKAKDVFVHVTDLRRARIDPDLVYEGDRVSFELQTGENGKTKAVEIRAIPDAG